MFTESYQQMCQHEFKFGAEKMHETCTGTHDVNKCCLCGADYYAVNSDKLIACIMSVCDKKRIGEHVDYTQPYSHYHVWRENGTCGYKLVYPNDNQGNNYAFEKTGPNMHVEIVERRVCNAKKS